MKRLFWIFFLFSSRLLAQDTLYDGMHIEMDEVVFKAAKNGWDVQSFIRRMKTDTTFYKAFVSLRVVPYESDNEIQVFDEHKQTLATLHNNTKQTMNKDCRTVTILNEKVTGNYYNRDKTPRYYTAELFQNLFFRQGTECGMSDNIAKTTKAKGSLERHKEHLKQLVFNPGSKISGVPFVGDKASIFDDDVAKMYDFKLTFVTYEGQECYNFQAIPKEEYKNDVVFNRLDTWFRMTDYSILARDYSLSYHTLLYDFDVQMKVRLEQHGTRLLPSSIDYTGDWHVMSKKRERSHLNIAFDY